MAKQVNDEPRRSNFDPDMVKAFVDRVESLHNDIASEKGAYMATCKGIREDISSVYDEAKEKGIPKKILKLVIEQRALGRKMEDIREELEQDDQDIFDQLMLALGDLADTPLGQAATNSAKANGGKAAVDTAASKANAEALQGGIHQLPH